MKRWKYLGICICVLICLPIVSAWAIWEGNAGIASASSFPGPGMYALSDMFPKNTIIEIRNLETEITIRAVITGSSGIPGLVAALSPETAAALNIKSGSVSRVRISIPATVSEQPASGMNKSGTGKVSEDPDVNPAAAVADAGTPVTLDSIAEPAAESLVPADSVANQEPVSEVSVADQPTDEDVVPTDTDVSEPEVTVVDSSVDSEVESTVVPDETEDAADTLDNAIDAGESPVQTVPEPPEAESMGITQDNLSEPQMPEAPVAVTVPDAVLQPATETNTDSNDIYDEPTLSLSSKEEKPAAPKEEKVESPEPVPEVSEVTLVPADSKPPVRQENEAPADIPVVGSIPSLEETAKKSIAATEPIPEVAVPSAPQQKIPPDAGAYLSANAVDLPYITEFTKGSYYIQIATYADISNVRKLVDAYGAKYPLGVLRTSTTRGEVLKVYIGPVTKDEYGAVLERFRQLGFKDAFVKKGW